MERLNIDKVEMYTCENFLSEYECKKIMEIADKNLTKSTVTGNTKNYRTSSTCHLTSIDNIEDIKFLEKIDEKICDCIQISQDYGEILQVQKYNTKNYFKKHTDFFEGSDYEKHCFRLGNRTYTFMIYINDVEDGGETFFHKLNLKIKPKRGQAIIWNNLYHDYSPNYDTLHSGEPVLKGDKYIITKWFRQFKN